MDGSLLADMPGDSNSATTPAPLRLDYFAPPEPLTGLVTTFYHLRHEAVRIRDRQPGAVGHIWIIFTGEGRLVFDGGRADPIHPASIVTPGHSAAGIEMTGPLEGIGVAVSPVGWGAFVGIDAGAFSDRVLPLSQVFGTAAEELWQALSDAHRRGTSPAALCERLGQFLMGRAKPVNPRHVKLIRATAAWLGSSLDPPHEELYKALPYSPRQAQRLVERYFGLSPRELKRKYRAIRAATLMALDHPSDYDLAATGELFSDQSHMIREIRHFVGRTPGRLSEESNTILAALLDIRNFRQVKPQIAPMPQGLGENDSQ